jgi:steroid delta-isomerase-like uncharacterized protein
MSDSAGVPESSATGTGAAIIRRGFDALARGDLDTFAAYVAPDIVSTFVGEPEPVHGRDSYMEVAAYFLSAFPDLHTEIHDVVECGDRVTMRLTYHGTHQGEFQGVAPTGRSVAFDSIEMYRVADGQVVEEWASFDTLGLLRQIGAIPAPGVS